MSGFDFVSYRYRLKSKSKLRVSLVLDLGLMLRLRPRPNPVPVVLEFCTPIRLYVCVNVLYSYFVCLNCVVYCSVLCYVLFCVFVNFLWYTNTKDKRRKAEDGRRKTKVSIIQSIN